MSKTERLGELGYQLFGNPTNRTTSSKTEPCYLLAQGEPLPEKSTTRTVRQKGYPGSGTRSASLSGRIATKTTNKSTWGTAANPLNVSPKHRIGWGYGSWGSSTRLQISEKKVVYEIKLHKPVMAGVVVW